MTDKSGLDGCAAPAVGQYLTPYCFGDATEAEREAFAAHLIDCDSCWEEVQQLEAAIRVVREDSSMIEPVVAADAVAVLGLSPRLNSAFGGHSGYVMAASAGYAVLCVLGLCAEVAYQFDRYVYDVLRVVPVLLLTVFAASVTAFALAWWRTRNGKTDALAWSILSILLGVGLGFGAGAAVLPATPIVQASFQTFTAQAGYLKSLLQTLPLSVFMMLMPFQFIVTLQRELKAGRYQITRDLLGGAAEAIPPRGSVFVRVRTLVALVAILVCVGLYMLSHLLENLQPARYANLFTLIAQFRAVVYFTLAVVSLVWYYRTLNELRREATVMTELRAIRR